MNKTTPEKIWHWGKANESGLPEWKNKNGNPTNDNGDQRVLNEPPSGVSIGG